ncbi:MAG: hypothetical protein JNK32_05230 [Anaerolineales bacterium]|nr:hypothetical protein [Anaerolineales bacterium]
MQRAVISDRIIPLLLFLDSLACILFALFAHALGFDPTPDMGFSRIVLFYLGVLLIFIAAFLYKLEPRSIQTEANKTVFLLGHIWSVIIVIYLFFVTAGTFTSWKNSTRYYSLLANAFAKGQLYVDVKPGAALLAADDPYNSEGRPAFDDDVWDLSLYKEKLYLYWGPVPALMLMPFQQALNTNFSDMYLVFFLLCGLLVVNSLILLHLWKHFFADIPMRYVVASIFVVGLILPILWSLSIPDVYEAAIGAGQFFLMGGIYFVLLAFEKDIPKKFLFLAGLFWACSVGSRAINVLPILFLIALTLFWMWKNQSKEWMQLSASLLTPLVMGAILIGWYNWARFDSPLEFGLRYQITIYNLNRDLPLAFQLDYLPYNIAAYLLQPFEFVSGFPFIQPVGFSKLLESLGLTTPKLYAAGHVTGILFFAPFLLFAVLPFTKRYGERPLTLVLYLLGGSFLISFISLLLYYYGQMRFLVDVISQASLLAIIGYWTLIRKSGRPFLHLANLLIVITLITSLLLAVTSESGRMSKINPALIDRLNSFFIQ